MTETQRRIRAARAYSGMTLDELAEKVGIGRMTLYRMENGQRDVKRMELREIAEACEVPFEFFTSGWSTLGAGALEEMDHKLDLILDGWQILYEALTDALDPEEEIEIPEDYDREAFVAALSRVVSRAPLVPPRAPDAVRNLLEGERSKGGSR